MAIRAGAAIPEADSTLGVAVASSVVIARASQDWPLRWRLGPWVAAPGHISLTVALSP